MCEEYAGNLGEKAAEHGGFPVDFSRQLWWILVWFLHPRSSLSEHYDDTQENVWNGKAQAHGSTLIVSNGW